VDPETKQRFDTLESAMVRLADGLDQTNAVVRELAGDVRELAQAQTRTEGRIDLLAQAQTRTEERIDRLAQLMIRGHTDAAERHATVIDRLDRLEGD
jgi:chromosome segregation ATPase